MFGLTAPAAVYLSTRPTDMRKAMDGLCGEVSDYLGDEPTDGSLFVFYNRRRDKLKMLYWDRDGYWVFYKRLEAGTFELPAEHGNDERRWQLSRRSRLLWQTATPNPVLSPRTWLARRQTRIALSLDKAQNRMLLTEHNSLARKARGRSW